MKVKALFGCFGLIATVTIAADFDNQDVILRSGVDGAEVQLPLNIAVQTKIMRDQIDSLGEKAVHEQSIPIPFDGPTLTRIAAALRARSLLGNTASIQEIKHAIAETFAPDATIDEINNILAVSNYMLIDDFIKPISLLLIERIKQNMPSEIWTTFKQTLPFSSLNESNMRLPCALEFPINGWFEGSPPFLVGENLILIDVNPWLTLVDIKSGCKRRLEVKGWLTSANLFMVEDKIFLEGCGEVSIHQDNNDLSKIAELDVCAISKSGFAWINMVGNNLFATKYDSSHISVIDAKKNEVSHLLTLLNGGGKIKQAPRASSKFQFVLIREHVVDDEKLFAIDGSHEALAVTEISLPPANVEKRLHSVAGELLVVTINGAYFMIDSTEEVMTAKALQLPQGLSGDVHFVRYSPTQLLAIHVTRNLGTKYFLVDTTTGEASGYDMAAPNGKNRFLAQMKNRLFFVEMIDDILSLAVIDVQHHPDRIERYFLEKVGNDIPHLAWGSRLLVMTAKAIRAYDLSRLF